MPLRAFNWSIQAPPLQQALLLLHQSAPGKYSSGSIAVELASTRNGKQECKIIESLQTEYMAYKMNTDKNTEHNMFCNCTARIASLLCKLVLCTKVNPRLFLCWEKSNTGTLSWSKRNARKSGSRAVIRFSSSRGPTFPEEQACFNELRTRLAKFSQDVPPTQNAKSKVLEFQVF